MLRSGIIVAFFTLLSRFFGLARELFIAGIFGSSSVADCVNVAFKFPNLFRRIFGEGALSAVFIPICNEKLIESENSARKFAGEIFTLLLIVLIIISTLMQLLMPYLMLLIAPGFYQYPEKYALATLLCQITTPYLVFISITALFGGILNSVRKFAAFAFSPIIMNICVIVVTLILGKHIDNHHAIAISLIIAGILQVGFMYFCLKIAKLTFPISFKPQDQDVRKLLKNMGPATMSSGVQQLNLFISQSIASFLPGAVSILAYADRLYQLPMALIGITFGTILLPELSRIYKKKNLTEANLLQNQSIQIGLAISIPAMCGLISLSEPIIHLIYERGAFNSHDTIQTANALAAFSLGLPAFVLAKILTPIFYANQDTKTPFKITIYSLVANTALNIILMIPFGHVGIALGSAIAGWLNVLLLGRYARNYGNLKINTETYLLIAKTIISSGFMLAFILTIYHYYSHLFFSESFLIKFIATIGTISIAAIIFILLCLMQKMHKTLNIKYAKKL